MGTNLKAEIASNTFAILSDEEGLALLATCTGTPVTTASLFSPGCMMVRTDSPEVYVNTGTTASPSWSLSSDTTSTQALSGAGAVDVVNSITEVTTTGADALTLADGSEGQHKYIVMVADGGDGTLTPTNLAGGTTITFNDVGDAVHLLFTSGSWFIVGNNGATVA